ncbi:cytochrome P450 [Hymenopellis radicata]|nr:cytochrome P450 [Hymenopellis radicata]
MPKISPWEQYARWGEEFDSDIIHLDVAGTSIVVLNSAEAASELLDGRSALYSDRPRAVMANELMGWDFMFGFMPYGDEWRALRRLFQQEFHPGAAQRYRPTELRATHGLLRRLLDDPEDFYLHIRHLAGATILGIAYGLDVLPKNDPYIQVAEAGLQSLAQAAAPGAFLVDALPILKYVPEWFPGAGFKRKAKVWRGYAMTMRNMPWAAAKQRIAEGTAVPSYTSYCMEKLDTDSDMSAEDRAKEEYRVTSNAATMYTGGTDSTLSVVSTFILAMIANPGAQARAQAEIDAVLQGELPTFLDYGDGGRDGGRLPYVTALVKEVFRWKNVTPLGIPHLIRTEDVYRGYRIPAGSIVMANAWAMLHNEITYPNPHEFDPDRFMTPDGRLDPLAKDPAPLFGFGRRVCPGQYMATSSIWIAIASILAVFHISKAVDEDGNVVEPSYEFASSLAS